MCHLTYKLLIHLLFALLIYANNTGITFAQDFSPLAGTNTNVDIKINGTITANGKCTFNRRGTISVDFGAVKYKKSQGALVLEKENTMPLVSEISCNGDVSGNLQMKLSPINGSTLDYKGTQVLVTTKTDSLAIELLKDGVPQDVDVWFEVNTNKSPKLEATLVQLTGMPDWKDEDVFSASAVLLVDFN